MTLQKNSKVFKTSGGGNKKISGKGGVKRTIRKINRETTPRASPSDDQGGNFAGGISKDHEKKYANRWCGGKESGGKMVNPGKSHRQGGGVP